MRQHVNPLSSFFQTPIELPRLTELFGNDQLPLHLDIGSAKGKFLIELATSESKWNYLGVEIRTPLVITAQREKDIAGLDNLSFLYCNANVSLESFLGKLPDGRLQRVSIQFPDPWFKRRHYKRRVLQSSLLISIARSLNIGSELFIQSDVFNIIQSMEKLIEISGCFVRKHPEKIRFLDRNPYKVTTERESYAIQKELKVYRILFYRNSNNIPDISFLESRFQEFNNIQNDC